MTDAIELQLPTHDNDNDNDNDLHPLMNAPTTKSSRQLTLRKNQEFLTDHGVSHNANVMAAQNGIVPPTQAFAIDLTGQVCADQFDGNFQVNSNRSLAAKGEFFARHCAALRGTARHCASSPSFVRRRLTMMWRCRTPTFAPCRWMQPKRCEVRGLSHKDVQRLCNVNCEDEAACAAATCRAQCGRW